MSQPEPQKDLENASAFAEALRQRLSDEKAVRAALKKHATPEQIKSINAASDKIASAIFNKAADAKKIVHEALIARSETYFAVLSQVPDDKLGEQVTAFLRNNFKKAAEKYGDGWPEVYNGLGAPSLAKFATEALRK